MRPLVALGLLAVLAAGCRRCDDTSLGGVEVGFRVDGAPLDFGRSLEGTQVERQVMLHSTGTVEVVVEASADSPFSVAAATSLPGGVAVSLPVFFTAGAGKAAGTLVLTANGKSVSLSLVGEGVRPLDCRPSAPCRVSQFLLEADACVETVDVDGAACTPVSTCLENGQCQAGVCIGTPRSCGDGNLCTHDACAESVGCVHTDVVCPVPQAQCQVAACDPLAGCGQAQAADGVPCGSIDCITANLCLSGECKAVPTPDNFICSPRTPCQGEGHCRSQKCERPDPAEMAPAWLVPLAKQPPPGGALLAHEGNLFFEVCDGGCELVSYTGSGFLRFTSPHLDGGARRLLAASGSGLIVLSPEGFEALAPTTGAPLWTLPYAQLPPPAEADGGLAVGAPGRVAVTQAGELVATVSWRPARPDAGEDAGEDAGSDAGPSDAGEADAGPWALIAGLQTLLQVGSDGGLVVFQTVRGPATESRVALGQSGELFLYDPAGPLARGVQTDAGYQLDDWGQVSGADSFATAGNRLIVGARELVDADGGARAGVLTRGLDGGTLALLPQPMLASQGRGYAFSRSCVAPFGPPCAADVEATFLHTYNLADGRPLWESKVLPEGLWARLDEAALVSYGAAVVTLSETELDGGRAAHVQLFAQGKRLFVCPLTTKAVLGPAVFDRGYVYVLVDRAGSWTLEAYELAGLPLDTAGWPQRDGVSGSRRAR